MKDLRQALHRRRLGAVRGHGHHRRHQLRRPKRSWRTIPEGTPADVDRAVAAAGAAFETWSADTGEGRAAKYHPAHRRGPRRAQRRDRPDDHRARSGMPMMLVQADPGRPADGQHRRLRADPRRLPVRGAASATRSSCASRSASSAASRRGTTRCTRSSPRSRRRSPPAAPSCSSRARSRRSTRSSSPRSSTRSACPPACSTSSPAPGPVVGEAIASHPDVDMVSFTGSTRAGKRVSELAAQTVKRVTLELGGKSANVILDDADLEQCRRRRRRQAAT